ncbi:MAG: phage tail protein I [Candidatus Margulisiibacteriota bacterium]
MSSLLPNNASNQERALEATLSRISDVPVSIRQIWNPDTCPETFLPWLAWSFSIDNWSPDWSASQKRETIKTAMIVHQRKGTIGAVRSALESLGYLLQVIEWFQEEDTPADPYTFRVLIDGQYEPITPQLFDDIVRIIRDTKNERSYLSAITIQRKIFGSFRTPTTPISGVSSRVYPLQITDREIPQNSRLGSGHNSGASTRIYPLQTVENQINQHSFCAVGQQICDEISVYPG